MKARLYAQEAIAGRSFCAAWTSRPLYFSKRTGAGVSVTESGALRVCGSDGT
jgi:hypothetical protein